MKKALIATTLVTTLLATSSFAAVSPSATSGNSTDVVSQASYLMGYHLASGLKAHGVPVDEKQLISGIKASIHNKPLSMSEQLQQKVMTDYQKMAQQKVATRMKKEGENNQTSGAAFLAKTAKEPGVKALPNGNGVLYKIIKEGKGPKPTANDSVVVNYEGTLTNGTVFDSSYKRGEPAIFGVSQVIKGWTDALQQMPVGSTWMIYIPADMAYGASGTPGGPIPPNSVLTFKVELLKIK